MLAKARRLRQERDIVRVYKKGRWGGAADLHAKAFKTGWPEARMAIVVSKKVSKKAVVRNRIRRRVAGQVEELWNSLVPGYDIVVTVRSDVSEATAPELKKQLSQALSRTGAINEEKPHV